MDDYNFINDFNLIIDILKIAPVIVVIIGAIKYIFQIINKNEVDNLLTPKNKHIWDNTIGLLFYILIIVIS